MFSEQGAAKLFADAVREVAEASGRRLGYGNEYEIPAMAKRAAGRIFGMPAERRTALVNEGIDAFRELALEMVRIADSGVTQDPQILGEQTLGLALAARGPFPPFW